MMDPVELIITWLSSDGRVLAAVGGDRKRITTKVSAGLGRPLVLVGQPFGTPTALPDGPSLETKWRVEVACIGTASSDDHPEYDAAWTALQAVIAACQDASDHHWTTTKAGTTYRILHADVETTRAYQSPATHEGIWAATIAVTVLPL